MLALALLLGLTWLVLGVTVWTTLHLIGQNGRVLQRLEELEETLATVRAEISPRDPTREAPAVAADPAPPAIVPAAPAAMRRGLARGTDAPPFALPDLGGAPRSLEEYRGRKVLVVFFHPRCGYCLQMLPGIAALAWEPEGKGLVPLVISSGSRDETCEALRGHKVHCPVLLQDGMQIAARYGVDGTPMGYLIDESGRIASDVAIGEMALLALAPQEEAAPVVEAPQRGNRPLTESKIERDGLASGTRAPSFRLPTVTNTEVTLEQFRGRPLLLVFSDPDCGPCDAMAPGLEAFSSRQTAVQVLMISRGTGPENEPKVRQHGFTFPVALQRRWEISLQYAKFGTPIAYHIDGAGVIAEEVAVGAEGVLEMAERMAASVSAPALGRHRREVVSP